MSTTAARTPTDEADQVMASSTPRTTDDDEPRRRGRHLGRAQAAAD